MPILYGPNQIAVKMGNLDVGFQTGFMENLNTGEKVAAFKFAKFKTPQKNHVLDKAPDIDEFEDDEVEIMVLFPADNPKSLDTFISALQKFRLESYKSMLYTILNKEHADKRIENDINYMLDSYGNVWKNKEDAEEFLDESGKFAIYGVMASWDTDTIANGNKWRALNKSCKLVKLS